MTDWGIRDQAAAQKELCRHYPQVPLWVIGHSLGGFLLPFQPNAHRIDRAIIVASGPAQFSDHPRRYRLVAATFWWGPAAWLMPWLGYFPGKLFRMGPNIPRRAFVQWRSWCTKRGFFMDQVGKTMPLPDWQKVRARMKFVAISDDDLVPAEVVWRTMQMYPKAIKRQLVLRPEDFGLRKIGHIAAFHRDNAILWPKLLEDWSAQDPTPTA